LENLAACIFSLLGCYTVYCCDRILTFTEMHVGSIFREAAWTSKMTVSYHNTTLRENQEDFVLKHDRRESLELGTVAVP
jgi:hypothetical protein